MRINIRVEVEAELVCDSELMDMEDAVQDMCKEYGHKAEATATRQ